ncbi:MAG: hypothetical protein EXS33_01750 [Pedosphaera sp.]|nr:hypothetical protein [Pedosphaera sp.]
MPPPPAHHPKILFVNEFAPDSLLVADLSRQLLLGYPADRLAWWHWRPGAQREVRDLQVGSRHFWPLPEKWVPNRKFAALKSAVMERVFVPLAARHLRRTIAEVKPDVVWVLAFSWPILIARNAIRKSGPRLHVSLWDMPDTRPQRKTLGDARTCRMLDGIYQLIRQADSCDGISPAVMEEIAAKTERRDVIPVHSGFEPHHLRALEAMSPGGGEDVIRLAYVGTIISEKTFLALLAALNKVRATSPRPVVLEFFGARNYRSRPWFDPQWMVEHGIFSDQGLVESLQRCEWGIVVMDLEGEDLRYSRFSFPNKIGTYLSAGVPVLGVGHPQSCLTEIMQRHRMGRCLSEGGEAALEKFLSDILKTPQPRSFFRDDILQCARAEFNATEIRQRLWTAWGARLLEAGKT